MAGSYGKIKLEATGNGVLTVKGVVGGEHEKSIIQIIKQKQRILSGMIY